MPRSGDVCDVRPRSRRWSYSQRGFEHGSRARSSPLHVRWPVHDRPHRPGVVPWCGGEHWTRCPRGRPTVGRRTIQGRPAETRGETDDAELKGLQSTERRLARNRTTGTDYEDLTEPPEPPPWPGVMALDSRRRRDNSGPDGADGSANSAVRRRLPESVAVPYPFDLGSGLASHRFDVRASLPSSSRSALQHDHGVHPTRPATTASLIARRKPIMKIRPGQSRLFRPVVARTGTRARLRRGFRVPSPSPFSKPPSRTAPAQPRTTPGRFDRL